MRDGQVFLFLPPMDTLETYLALCKKIEEAATQLEIPVVIEGYHPPVDPRMEKLVVGPDPGVIEVNIHPATSWKDMVSNYDTFRYADGMLVQPYLRQMQSRIIARTTIDPRIARAIPAVGKWNSSRQGKTPALLTMNW